MKTIILVGAPGSGKNHHLKHIIAGGGAMVMQNDIGDLFFFEEWDTEKNERVFIFSADHYTFRNGNDKFERSDIPVGHRLCLRGFATTIDKLKGQECILVVNNTNTTPYEIAPYAALAQAYDSELEIRVIKCDPEVAFARNVHGVPREVFDAMIERLYELDLPPWWPVTRWVDSVKQA